METNRLRLAAGVFWLASSTASAFAATIEDKGHYGVVVEVPSGKPIGDAVIEATWSIGYSSLGHGGSNQVKVLVVESDSEGRFALPAWKHTRPDVNGFWLVLKAKKEGYRQVDATLPHARQSLAFKLMGAGSMEIESTPIRIEMARGAGAGR